MKSVIVNCIIPVSVGGFIYILGRNECITMFHWMELINLKMPIQHLRTAYKASALAPLPHWVLYSLPDGLWMYSFTAAIFLLWKCRLNAYLLIPLILGSGSEIGQYFDIVRGTYDTADLICYCMGFSLPIIILNKSNNHVQESSVSAHHL